MQSLRAFHYYPWRPTGFLRLRKVKSLYGRVSSGFSRSETRAAISGPVQPELELKNLCTPKFFSYHFTPRSALSSGRGLEKNRAIWYLFLSMNKNSKLIALFFVSIAGISYELYVMRIFSVGGWSNFGSLVISTALLGIGLSGILLTFLSGWVERWSEVILSVCAISLPLLMSLAVIMAQLVPFNPVFLASDSRQLWFIGAYYIVYGAPFFVVASFTGVSFIALREQIQKVYFWNMIGSGVGGFFIIIFMFLLPPQYLLLPILGLTLVAALFTCVICDDMTCSYQFSAVQLLPLVLTALCSICFTFFWGDIRVSDYKAISYVRKYPDSKLVHHSYGPGGEYHVYFSQYFHFAPGLSDNAALKVPNISSQRYWGLFIDGSGPIGIMGAMREDERAYMDYLPMAAPYTMISNPDVLLINLSGGINAQVARYKGARSIDIVEPSSEMIRLLRNDRNIIRFTGDLFNSENLNVIQGEPRAYCADHRESYNLIELSLVDSIGLSDSGGYPIHEDYKYTVEAFKEYFASLKPGGVLSVTVWDRLNPPRNVLKLLNTIIMAMKESGMRDPGQNLYSFGLFMSTTTILVKKTPFTAGEIYDLNNFVRTRSFEPLYVPGAELPRRDINILLGVYQQHFEKQSGDEVESFTNADMYRTAIPEFFAGKAEAIENQYVFDIRPIKDSRPYYSGFLKLGRLPIYLDQMEDVSEEWGYLLLLGILVQACIFGLFVILLPVIVRWKELSENRRGTIGVIFYYAGLGLGYMLIEIFLIQRLSVFLSNPTYSTSIVITVMLIFSALGNLASSCFKSFRFWIVPASGILIAAGLFFYIFGLDGFLAGYHSSSLPVRVFASMLIIAPVAFFMGIPYPNGLDALQGSKPHLLPWAWGMNGGLSVAGSALARVLSVSSGFPILLGVGIAVYLMVGLLFPVNEEDGFGFFRRIR
jgi:SAM-dependent methyltransferase